MWKHTNLFMQTERTLIELGFDFSGVRSVRNVSAVDFSQYICFICNILIYKLNIFRGSQCEERLCCGGEDGDPELHCEEPGR